MTAATSTATTGSTTSTGSIDVASIVSQLMTVANKPLVDLQNQVSNENVIISDLGVLKSKMATFQSALTAFESPSTFNTASASSTNSTVATATVTNGAPYGRYNLSVAQTAESSNISVKGYSSLTQSANLDPSGFSITIGTQTYNTNNTYNSTTSPPTTGGTLAALGANPTVTDLNNWINSLTNNFSSANVSSSLLLTGSGSYALVINGTETGIANAISFSGLNGGSVTTSSGVSSSSSNVVNGSNNVITVNTNARDALFTLNGLNFQRSSNSVSDIYSGVTFNLGNPVLPNLPSSGNLVNGEVIPSTSTSIGNLNTSLASTGNYTFTSSGSTLTLSNGINSQTVTLTSLSGANATESVNFSNLGVSFSLYSNDASTNASAQHLASQIVTQNPTFQDNNNSTSTLITISQGADNSSSVINSFISAYNDVITQYYAMTANPVNTSGTTATTGSLGNDPQMLSFVQNIQFMLSSGALTQSNEPISLSSMGIDFQIDGTLKFNSTNFATAQANGLLKTLSSGLNIGGSVGSSNNLDLVVSSALNPVGVIAQTTSLEQSKINNLMTKEADLQTQLAQQQTNLTNQYAALNTLLYNLSQTSSQLTSSLAAVTNINTQTG
jgi:flagellar hook-associated protein 2